MDKAHTNNAAGQQIMAEGYTGADWVRTARRPYRTASQRAAEAHRYDDDSEDDGMHTTDTEAGAPVAAESTTKTVTVVSGRGSMRGYSGQTATVESESAMGIVVRFADGMTRTARASEIR